MAEDRRSIYEYMAEQMGPEGLPEDFSLPSESKEAGGLQWADGAADGVYLYHMQHSPVSEEVLSELIGGLRLASAQDTEAADRAFSACLREHPAITIADRMLSWIIEHVDELDAAGIYRYGIHLMIESPEREMVKLGLSLMRLFDTDTETLGDVIRSLGLSDEFTLFSAMNLQRWEKGNEELFDLARRVRGWGRIHALERLEPETGEIRDWILAEGADNDVMPQYSALTAFEKSGAAERLRRGTEPWERKAIGKLFSWLMDESAIVGISGVEQPGEMLRLYLEQLAPSDAELEDLEQVQAVYYYAAGTAQALEAAQNDEEKAGQELPDPEDLAQLKAASRKAVELLRSPECEAAVKEAVRSGRGIELAAALGLPYRQDLLRLMTDDFENNYDFCGYLMDSPAYAEAVLDLFRKKTDWTQLEKGGPGNPACAQAQALLEAMKGDCRTAGDILLKALGAASAYLRYAALECLEAWVEKAGQPLQVLSQRISDRLGELKDSESEAALKEKMEGLLEGLPKDENE